MNSSITGVIAMMITGFLWSIAGLFIKMIDWNPIAIAGIRSLIASIVILIYLKRPRFTFSFAQVAAAIANALTMLCFVMANKTTTAANAILLQYIAPVVTAFIGAFLLKERVNTENRIALILVSIGLIIMFMDKVSGGSLFGNLIALLSGVFFSLYFIFMRMQKAESPLESSLLSNWITVAISLVICLFLPLPVITVHSIIAISILGIFQIGVSSILFSFAIKRISAVSANLIAIIEPIFNPVWVFLILGESPGINVIIGGGIIVLSVMGASIASSRRK